jgi:hypothetical protein
MLNHTKITNISMFVYFRFRGPFKIILRKTKHRQPMKPVLRVTHLNLMALAAILDCFFIVNIFWLMVLTPFEKY